VPANEEFWREEFMDETREKKEGFLGKKHASE
jgi:hypothetical protein